MVIRGWERMRAEIGVLIGKENVSERKRGGEERRCEVVRGWEAMMRGERRWR